MTIQWNLKVTISAVVLIGGLLTENAMASAFPIAANSSVTEFGGGVVPVGTNYLVGIVSGSNLALQLVSGDGQLQGSPQVLGAPGFPPAAALAGASTKSLVAWSDTSLSSGVTMFGQLISSNGSPVGSKFPLLHSAGSYGFQYVQAAASDGTNFFVVWRASANRTSYGQLISSSGALLGSEVPLFSIPDQDHHDLAIAFGRTNYLAVWQAGMNSSNNTFGELISLSGKADAPFQLNTTPSRDKDPSAVAFDGTNYFAVWSCDTNYTATGEPDWNLCGRLVSQTGSVVGDELTLVTENASFPGMAFDGSNYLIAWGFDTGSTNADATIHAQFLDRSGEAVGPVFTPFPPEGTYPPLLPIHGVLFHGGRYLLTATYATFALDNSGDVAGLMGGDVYGRFMPASSQLPAFTDEAVSGGVFQGHIEVVPGQTYTIEVSTNLLDWSSVNVASSATTNVISVVDPRSITNYSRMFYRLSISNALPP